MNGKNRSDVYSGLEVDIILKKDQRTGNTTRGIIKHATMLISGTFGIRDRLVRPLNAL